LSAGAWLLSLLSGMAGVASDFTVTLFATNFQRYFRLYKP
jgi:hypothetical protein